MSSLNGIIDRLSAARTIYTQPSFVDLLAEPPELRCPRLTRKQHARACTLSDERAL